ncbi:MAG: 2Fe-2S iron-sulfur cluster-binding protein [Pseudomonadota bacterium]
MVTVTWKLSDSSDIVADVENGMSMMDAAVLNDVPRIMGECGGCLSCATCHVFVDTAWLNIVGEADVIESSMLEMTEVPRTESSRLSCQIEAHDELDGLVLHVPAA